MLLISWFADGRYWENMLMVPFYLQGLSYFRPFRYRDEWISPELQVELQNDLDSVISASKKEHTLLCAKFLDSEQLIPIREVELTQITQRGNEYYIYFRVGRFIDYRDTSSLLTYTTTVKDGIRLEDQQKLFHKSSIEIGSLRFVPDYDQVAEIAAWTDFVDLLCDSNTLPLDKVRESVFMKLVSLSEQGSSKVLKPELIGETKSEGDIYGFNLKEGKGYELEILNRVPCLIDTDLSMEPFEYKISVSERFLEVSPKDEEVSGNYQPHVFSLHALRPSPRESLDFEAPPGKMVNYSNGTLHVSNLRIFIKNSFSLIRYLKVWAPPMVVLFGGLFLTTMSGSVAEEGWRSAFLSIPTIWKAVGSAIGSFAVLLGINWLRWQS